MKSSNLPPVNRTGSCVSWNERSPKGMSAAE
jgi:hypothetical protein